MAIYYATGLGEVPIGGIKKVFRHVEVLAAAGWDCRVLGLAATAPPSWLKMRVPLSFVRRSLVRRVGTLLARVHPKLCRWSLHPLLELDDPRGATVIHHDARRPTRLTANDVLVLPEYFGMALRRPRLPCRVVIFNQNVHYMFRGLAPGGSLGAALCADDQVPTIVVSRHNAEYVRYAFPRREVHLVTNGVDPEVFRFQSEKKRQIAFMPRKLPADLAHVLAMLANRGALNGWDLCPLDGLTEAGVAERLGESAVFLSTCTLEGFGLPPLEALLSGCVVVGYAGVAAAEFLDETTAFPVPQEDRLVFARRLEALLADLNARPAYYRDRSATIAERLRETYSPHLEQAAVLSAWQRLAPDHDPERRAR